MTVIKGCAWSMPDRLWAAILIAMMVACQRPDAIKIPEDTLSESTMVAILTDIHLVEGAKVGNKIMGDTLRAPVYFNKIYQKHQISKEEFEKNFRFYTAHPKLMNDIYEQVIENLNKIETAPPREVMTDDLTREQTPVSRPLKDITEKVKAQKKADTARAQPE